MISINDNYRKTIGDYNNRRNDRYILPWQEQRLVDRLARNPGDAEKRARALVLINLIAVLSNVSQVHGDRSVAYPSASAHRSSPGRRCVSIEPVARATVGRSGTSGSAVAAAGCGSAGIIYADAVFTRASHKSSLKKPRVVRSLINWHRPRRAAQDAQKPVEPTVTIHDKAIPVKALFERYYQSFPDILSTAAQVMKSAISRYTGQAFDPDKIYFHRFSSAQNDPAALTGWRHCGKTLIETRSVTECLLTNFPADAQDNMDVVDQMTGIYSVAAGRADYFGGENQIPILPSTIAKIIFDINFYQLFTDKLTQYWQKDIQEMMNLTILILSLHDLKLKGGGEETLYLDAFNLGIKENHHIKKFIFDINGYQATDMIMLTEDSSTRVAVYMPRSKQKFRIFNNQRDFTGWFIRYCRDENGREDIAKHFSIRTRQDGWLYAGIDYWLGTFAKQPVAESHVNKIWRGQYILPGDLNTHLLARQAQRTYDDADNGIKSNAEIGRDMAIRYFSVVNMLLPNPITPFVSLGLDIDKMINGDNELERKQGASFVLNDGLNIALMALSEAIAVKLSLKIQAGEWSAGGSQTGRSFTQLIRQEMSGLAAAPARLTIPARLKVALDRHIHLGINAAELESALVIDPAGEIFIDPATQRRYIKYADKFFLIEGQAQQRYVLSGLTKKGNKKYICRFGFSQAGGRSSPSMQYEMPNIVAQRSRPLAKRPAAKVRLTLTDGEINSLDKYVTINTDRVNALMMTMAQAHPEAAAGEGLMDQIEAIRSALQKMPSFQGTVFRRCVMSKDDLSRLQRGEMFFNPSFILASADKAMGKKLAPIVEDGFVRVFFKILIKNNAHAIDYSNEILSGHAVIINDRTRFQLVDIKPHRLTLKEIATAADYHHIAPGKIKRVLDAGITDADAWRLQQRGDEVRRLLQQNIDDITLTEQQREQISSQLMELARQQVASAVIDEYTEAGSDVINDWLRFGRDALTNEIPTARDEAQNMLAAAGRLKDFGGYAYRSVECPRAVYANAIKEGDMIMDRGFMSASAIPINCLKWRSGWTRNTSKVTGASVIMVFDASVPKKIASTSFLVDHILIQPRTALRVMSMTSAVDNKGERVTIVCVSKGWIGGVIKDIFSGAQITR